MGAAPLPYPSPIEFLARAVGFGLLVIGGIASIVLAGSWWAACIAAAGMLVAVAGLVVSALELVGDEEATRRRSSRATALALAALAVGLLVVALVA
jgi:hypothetical protein